MPYGDLDPGMSSLKSPETDSPSNDPFDLQRLAEELVTREQNSSSQSHPRDPGDEITKAERALPVYVPLSHSNPYLSAKGFDVEDFLLSRAYTSLPDLRTELRDYLATLKEELVKLINDDYEAFISLSTDLRGEGARLERLKSPLSDMKSHVLVRRVLQCMASLICDGVLGSATSTAGRQGRRSAQTVQAGDPQGGEGMYARTTRERRLYLRRATIGFPSPTVENLGIHHTARVSPPDIVTRRR